MQKHLVLAGAIVTGVIVYYELGNLLFKADPNVAHAHGLWIWHLEQKLGIAVEGAFQDGVLALADQLPGLLTVMSVFYVVPHFVVTLGLYAWLAWKKPQSFLQYRNVLAISTLVAFTFQWIVPVSPPWLTPETQIEYTLAHMSVNGSSPEIQQLTNPYAAFPSVHTSWALISAWHGARAYPKWRAAWYSYAALVIANIVGTGNHYFLDIVGAVPFIVVGYAGHLWLTKKEEEKEEATEA